MDEEPTGNTPPPQRPWAPWKWFMPLWLITPSLLIIAGATIATSGATGSGTVDRVITSGFITVPIAMSICFFLAGKITDSHGSSSHGGGCLCVVGIIALNFAIIFTKCSMTGL